MKGYLEAIAIPVPRVHDVAVLLQIAAESSSGFQQFLDMADALSSYAVATRYPDEGVFVPDREDAEKAVETAAELLSFVTNLLEGRRP